MRGKQLQLDYNKILDLSPEQVVEAARKALAACDTPALDIYKATDLTPAWQQAFVEGRSKDPAYTRVMRLIDWLDSNHNDLFTTACADVK